MPKKLWVKTPPVKTEPAVTEVGVLGCSSATSPSPAHGSRAGGSGSWAKKRRGSQRPVSCWPDPTPYIHYLAKPLTTAGLRASQKER